MKYLIATLIISSILIVSCHESKYDREVDFDQLVCQDGDSIGIFFSVLIGCSNNRWNRNPDSCRIEKMDVSIFSPAGEKVLLQNSQFLNVSSKKLFSMKLDAIVGHLMRSETDANNYWRKKDQFLNKEIPWDSLMNYFRTTEVTLIDTLALNELSRIIIVDHICGGEQSYWFQDSPKRFMNRYNESLERSLENTDSYYCGLGFDPGKFECDSVGLEVNIGGQLVRTGFKIEKLNRRK